MFVPHSATDFGALLLLF